jgi:hypothetical protein
MLKNNLCCRFGLKSTSGVVRPIYTRGNFSTGLSVSEARGSLCFPSAPSSLSSAENF